MTQLRLLLVALLACGSSACSTFDRDWRAAGRADPFSGAWDGQWTSEKHRLPNGQPAGGRLRCIFTKRSATQYHARFHANWLCFATGYETTFQTKRRARVLTFRGEQDLGRVFGGVYRYEGAATGERFRARFTARSDHGTFDLRRPDLSRLP